MSYGGFLCILARWMRSFMRIEESAWRMGVGTYSTWRLMGEIVYRAAFAREH